jgi:hypothetical protein
MRWKSDAKKKQHKRTPNAKKMASDCRNKEKRNQRGQMSNNATMLRQSVLALYTYLLAIREPLELPRVDCSASILLGKFWLWQTLYVCLFPTNNQEPTQKHGNNGLMIAIGWKRSLL